MQAGFLGGDRYGEREREGGERLRGRKGGREGGREMIERERQEREERARGEMEERERVH